MQTDQLANTVNDILIILSGEVHCSFISCPIEVPRATLFSSVRDRVTPKSIFGIQSLKEKEINL